ncbi:MAG: PfkB family carbohydrate kinase [Bacillota bacterium]|nr:PfkB family carbohydrate kinase [Bacillota bacterium]
MLREYNCPDYVDRAWLQGFARQSRSLAAAVIGDGALDAWWFCDMRRSELSLETPFPTWPVVSERYGCGAAANVAVQLRTLGVGRVCLLSVIGRDWRADLLESLLTAEGISTEALIRTPERQTPAYLKPVLEGYPDAPATEVSRLDFLSAVPLADDLEAEMLTRIRRLAAEVDFIIVSDQYLQGCLTPALRAEISAIGRGGALPVVVDSRHHLGAYSHVFATPNRHEAREVSGCFDLHEAGRELARRLSHDLAVTCGGEGALAVMGGEVHHLHPPRLDRIVDTVGAGDCFSAALAASWAVGRKNGQVPAGLRDVAFATAVATVSTRQRGTGRIRLHEVEAVLFGET